MCCFALETHQFSPTFRTILDELHLLHARLSLVFIDTHHLGDDFTTFLHIHHVANVKIKFLHHIGIVERGAFHNRTCQLHRVHVRNRSHSTRSSHLISHFVEPRTSPFCFKFIGNSPARTLCRITQMALLTQRVHFQHDAIRRHRQVLAFLVPIVDECQHLLNGLALLHALRNLESPRGSFLQVLIMETVVGNLIA